MSASDPGRLTTMAAGAAIEAGKVIMEVLEYGDLAVKRKEDDSPVTIADLRADRMIRQVLSVTGLPVLSEEGGSVPFGERRSWPLFWLVDPLDGTRGFISGNGEFTVNIALISRQRPVAGIVYLPGEDIMYAGTEGAGAWRLDDASQLPAIAAGQKEPAAVTEAIGSNGKALPYVRRSEYGIVGSRNYLDDLTRRFIEEFISRYPGSRWITVGSARKLCLLATGEADIYPRFSNISEWDTAAGHAILAASGGNIVQVPDTGSPLEYNKETSENPWFIAYRDRELLNAVKGMIPVDGPGAA